MDNKLRRSFRVLTRISVVVALGVMMLGAYVRLSDAGLGCPDWPGCYGHLFGVPDTAAEISHANEMFPDSRVHTDKAWKEMAHRYPAGIFGFLILALTVIALWNRKDAHQPVAIPVVLLGLTLFQAVLGMWTVTLLLKPLVVTAHLLGGMAILSLLWWLVLQTSIKHPIPAPPNAGYSLAAAIAVTVLLVVQIALGGWTSTNYAALACQDFPTCQQQWWPATMDFNQALRPWQKGLGIDYEFGVLESPARTAIHILHRVGAVVVILSMGTLLLLLLAKAAVMLKLSAAAGLLLLVTQTALGISNVVFSLPIGVATAHHGTAAMLLIVMITIMYMLKSPARTTGLL